jgi:hypothetical protein
MAPFLPHYLLCFILPHAASLSYRAFFWMAFAGCFSVGWQWCERFIHVRVMHIQVCCVIYTQIRAGAPLSNDGGGGGEEKRVLLCREHLKMYTAGSITLAHTIHAIKPDQIPPSHPAHTDKF